MSHPFVSIDCLVPHYQGKDWKDFLTIQIIGGKNTSAPWAYQRSRNQGHEDLHNSSMPSPPQRNTSTLSQEAKSRAVRQAVDSMDASMSSKRNTTP